MTEIAVFQKPYPMECARRVRFEWTDKDEVHLILEEEERSGDRLFEDERGRVTVPWTALLAAVADLRETMP